MTFLFNDEETEETRYDDTCLSQGFDESGTDAEDEVSLDAMFDFDPAKMAELMASSPTIPEAKS